jgi:hypothetical protein
MNGFVLILLLENENEVIVVVMYYPAIKNESVFAVK